MGGSIMKTALFLTRRQLYRREHGWEQHRKKTLFTILPFLILPPVQRRQNLNPIAIFAGGPYFVRGDCSA
jgi:hypothetical protein